MTSLSALGKVLLVLGLAVAAIGVVLLLLDKVPGVRLLGRLPGDITWRGKHGSVYFPLATCLLLSVIVSLLLHLFRK
jgi:hypothetical protein